MAYTLGQAAKATGKQKSTLLDAIRTGRLSASRDDKNQWQIDPAELARVYPPNTSAEREETRPEHYKTALLEEKIRFLEREIRLLEQTAEDMRDDRDHWRRQATHLLTDQRQPQAEASPPKPAPPGVRLPFWFALIAVGAAAASWYLWPWVMGNH